MLIYLAHSILRIVRKQLTSASSHLQREALLSDHILPVRSYGIGSIYHHQATVRGFLISENIEFAILAPHYALFIIKACNYRHDGCLAHSQVLDIKLIAV